MERRFSTILSRVCYSCVKCLRLSLALYIIKIVTLKPRRRNVGTNNYSNTTEKSKTSRRFIAGIFLLVSAFAIIIGAAFAFFSDKIEGDITVTAGTLNIAGTTSYYVNGSATAVTSVPNFNPGDVVVAKTTVTNTGNKSAWVRNRVDLTGIDAAISPYIKVYAGEKTLAAITLNPSTDLIASGAATTPVILNGVGSSAESEAGGLTSYDAAITVFFDTTAVNAAQGKAVAVKTLVEAMQYRNNPSPSWTAIEQL